MTVMYTIINLFGRSPFAPLQSHMEKVGSCVHMLPDLFTALEAKNYEEVEKIGDKISELEHAADFTKNNIRNNLPRTLFLPIDRRQLLEILSLQDNIADTAEDVGVLVNLKPIELLEHFKEDFNIFLNLNIETYNEAEKIIKEIHELLETSFGGNEAEKVKLMVDHVAFKEHEVDLIQRRILKKLFASESQMSYSSFHLWQKIFEALANISNLSEKLANRIRMTLEPK
jgi:uncharacterized protein